MKRKTTKKSRSLLDTHWGILTLFIIATLFIGIVVVLPLIRPDVRTNAAAAASVTGVLTVAQEADIANEDGKTVTVGTEKIWLGTGADTANSYLGVRFSGTGIPKKATVLSARMEVTQPEDSWIPVGLTIFAESANNTEPFSRSNPPSRRIHSTTSVTQSDNVKWKANTVYSLDVTKLVQELVTTAERENMVFILKGSGSKWGRKYIWGSPATKKSPRLVVTYTTDSTAGSMSATKTPSPSPVSTTATKTPTPMAGHSMTNTPIPTTQIGGAPAAGSGSTSTGGNSHALGLWTPTKWDTCTKAIHDAYSVIGPDGKRYPTWHPPVDPKTGCSFGHEHGRDPSKSLIWNDVRKHFAYDADKNGQISDAELASAGIPFGYVNEQLDNNAVGMMRHEDHVGHKIEWANGEPDMGTDQFDANPTGGVVVPVKTNSTPKWKNIGARCFHMAKVHQGVSTGDAFTNNLHEVMYFVKCTGPSAAYDMQAMTATLMQFGKAGEFTNLCDAEGDRTTPIVLGTTATNANYPGSRGSGARNIIQRSCVEKHFLVPDGTFSMNFYEAWPGTISLSTSGGRRLLWGANLLFDVEDANRYFYPGKPNNVGYSMDLCYEKLAGGRQARGGSCDSVTNYGKITGITWDDPRSAFRGLHRGMYFQPPVLENAGGSEVWYTDVFGGKAQTTPFAGSVKQYLSAKNVNHNSFGQTDPRINDRSHDDGNGTVHAPN